MVAKGGEPAPFTEAEVAALCRGTMPKERVGRILELQAGPVVDTPAPRKSDKLAPAPVSAAELAELAAGYPDDGVLERLAEAGKLDRTRKRAIPKGAGRPRLRPPSLRRKRKS